MLYLSRTYGNRNSSSEMGGALAELAIVMPVLIFLLFGMVEIGRVLIEMVWMGNTSFSAAVLGAESHLGVRTAAMSNRATNLIDILDDRFRNKVHSAPAIQSTFNAADKTVRVKIAGHLQSLTGKFSIPVKGEIVGPVFVDDSGFVTSDGLNDWGNSPDTCLGMCEYRKCDGTYAGFTGSTLPDTAFCGYS